MLKSKMFKAILLTAALLSAFMFAACGGNNNQLGGTPQIPGWTESITAASDADGIGEILENNNWENVEIYENMITAEKTIDGKDYIFMAMVYDNTSGAENYFGTLTTSWSQINSLSGEYKQAALDALAEEGITNFRINENGISFTQDGYDCFYAVTGNVVMWQVPAGDDEGNPNNPGEAAVILPANVKIEYSFMGQNTTFIKINEAYYLAETFWGMTDELFLRKNTDGTWSYYIKDYGDAAWGAAQTQTDAQAKSIIEGMIGDLNPSPYGNQGSNTTFLGRECKTITYNNVEWELSYTYYIDIETKLCLYSDISGMITEVSLFNTGVTNFGEIQLPQ